ncbi:hypothetical protein HPB52_015647 [Rhipicephalus sanguineus]|uniref:Chitinase n=1 Tax=Rhipicephalus sanguineus TaxID=34632 RepID=A0A9D4Q780_RHISA|nr:hypothetical protein HPB52_015647 [Rhipicephalus sanguineus]
MADSRQDTELPDQYADVGWLRTPDSAAMSPPQLPWSTSESPVQSLGSPPVLPATIVARSAQSHKASAYATPTFISHHPLKKTHHGDARQATGALPKTHAASAASASAPSTWSPTPPRAAAQRHTGFAGVPAYVLAPDVIIFSPRSKMSPPLQEQREEALTMQPPSYSPAERPAAGRVGVGQPVISPHPELESGSGGQADQDFNFGQGDGPGFQFWFKQAWALCVVTVGTFIMPVGLLILSYSNTPPAVKSSVRTVSVPAASVTTSTGPSGWPPLPSKCTESPQLNGSITNLYSSRLRRFNVEPNNTVFCVYNVTRFKKLSYAVPRIYAPQNMPLEYCRSVVYWSMAVGADKIESRAQYFDNVFGAAALRPLITSSQLPGPKTLLLALGGFQSDSVHLTNIARHQRQLVSFTESVLEMVALYGMDGVAVHWVPPEATCRVPGRDDDLLTVSTIVDAISKAFSSNSTNKRVIALLLPADHAATDTLVNVLVNVVDYVIVQTHLLPLPPVPSDTLCTDLARNSTSFIRSLSLSPERDKKVCSGFSLSPLKVVVKFAGGHVASNFAYASNSSLDGLRARGQMNDVCDYQLAPCHYGSIFTDCIAVSLNAATHNPYFVFPKSAALQSIVMHELISRSIQRVPSDRCAALFDLDMDNWDDNLTCAGFDLPYRYLTHFHASIQGYSSPMHQLPRC